MLNSGLGVKALIQRIIKEKYEQQKQLRISETNGR